MESKINYDYKFKAVLMGDLGVGKSSLLDRLIRYENFSIENDILPTIGVNFRNIIIKLEKSEIKVFLNFFDLSGDYAYRSIAKSYFKYSQVHLILYDVNIMDSFLNCKNWLDLLQEDGPGDLIKILIGCKKDKVEKNKNVDRVPYKKAKNFAKQNGFALFYETSAKDNLNITELFQEICVELVINFLNYLNFQLSYYEFSHQKFLLGKCFLPGNLSLLALITKTYVHYNCKTEDQNFNHLIHNNLHSKRKNLLQKSDFFSFLDYFYK